MVSPTTFEVSDISGVSNLNILVADINKLVSLPDIYYRLESAIESPSSSVDDFAKLLGSDPDLCARLLSMANSAFYSFPAEIETIDRAISTIGLRQIRELVLATSILKMFNGVALESVDMSSFWEHSVAVGVLAKSIAQFARLPLSDRYYIPGLLHDLGRLVLYLKLPELMQDLLTQSNIQQQNLFLLERQQLSYTHAEIGGRLLELWKVPQSIYEPVYYHHRPDESHEFSHTTCTIHIADAWVNKNRLGSSGESNTPEIQPEAMQLLGIQESDLDEIWSHAGEEIRDVVRQFVSH